MHKHSFSLCGEKALKIYKIRAESAPCGDEKGNLLLLVGFTL